MASENLKRDSNFVTVMGAVTDDSDLDITQVRVNPTTKRLLVEDAESSVSGTPTVYNKTLTNADTEYTQTLPSSCEKFMFWARTNVDIRFAFETGKVATPTAPYLTLKGGTAFSESGLSLSSKTLYLASSTAGTVVEILCWT